MLGNNSIKKHLNLTVLSVLSFLLTAFILLNAYEQVFFKDLPYFQTLRVYNQNDALASLIDKVGNNAEFLHSFSKDTPRFVSFPTVNANVEITGELYSGGNYYVRGNKGHSIRIAESNTVVVYLEENWRTSTEIHRLKQGDLLFLLSDNYNYIFKIESVVYDVTQFKSISNELLKPELVIVSSNTSRTTILSASLINSIRR